MFVFFNFWYNSFSRSDAFIFSIIFLLLFPIPLFAGFSKWHVDLERKLSLWFFKVTYAVVLAKYFTLAWILNFCEMIFPSMSFSKFGNFLDVSVISLDILAILLVSSAKTKKSFDFLTELISFFQVSLKWVWLVFSNLSYVENSFLTIFISLQCVVRFLVSVRFFLGICLFFST